MFASLILLTASLAPAVLAKVFITAPVSGTVWPVDQQVTVTWQEDNQAPLLPQIGVCDVGIFAGSVNTQILLQQIGTLDVSAQSSITFPINSNIGPSGAANYFIRFTAQNAKDPNNAQFPLQAFSAMFSLSGATGTFNTTVLAEITGSAAPIPAAASTPAAAPAVAAASPSAPATTAAGAAAVAGAAAKSSATVSAAGASASAGSAVSAASPRFVAEILTLVGAAVAVFGTLVL